MVLWEGKIAWLKLIVLETFIVRFLLGMFIKAFKFTKCIYGEEAVGLTWYQISNPLLTCAFRKEGRRTGFWFHIMKVHSRSQNLDLVFLSGTALRWETTKYLAQFSWSFFFFFFNGLLHCQNYTFMRCPRINLYNDKISEETINV